MKKIFTLISLVCFAMGVSAQDVYVACPDGKLASEFAAVVGEGNVANNVTDNSSIITIEKENITMGRTFTIMLPFLLCLERKIARIDLCQCRRESKGLS